MPRSTALRFSHVTPQDIAVVQHLRDQYRGVTPSPPQPGGVPEGPQERLLHLVVQKAFIRSHTRTLPDGRRVTVQAYFDKRIPKKPPPKQLRVTKRAPPTDVYADATPERLAHHLVQRVAAGKLSHADAHANVTHLEQHAHRGLQHGHGHAWSEAEVLAFVGHAREKLTAHQAEQEATRTREEERKRTDQEEKEQRHAEEREDEDRRQTLLKEHDWLQNVAARYSRWASERRQARGALAERRAISAMYYQAKDFQRELNSLLDAGIPRAESTEKWLGELQTFKHAVTADMDGREAKDRAQATKRQKQQERAQKQVDTLQRTHVNADDPYSHVQDTQQRSVEEQQHNLVHFQDAPPYIQAALRKARALQHINPPGSRGSWYRSVALELSFRPASREKLYPGYTGAVWRHEYGHHVDYEIAGGGHTPASVSRKAALEADREALVPKDTPEQAEARQQATISAGEQLWAQAPIPLESGPARTEALAKLWEGKTGLTAQEVQSLLGANWAERQTRNHTDLLANWEAKDAKTFLGMVRHTTGPMAMVQDFFGAVTRNQIKIGFGHTDTYYGSRTEHTANHCTEAYANWTACHGNKDQVWRKLLAHFAPQTNRAFQEMTEQWLTTPNPT